MRLSAGARTILAPELLTPRSGVESPDLIRSVALALQLQFLLLGLATRRGLVSGEVALRIAGAADQGGEVRALLLGMGGLAEADVQALEWEAESWIAGGRRLQAVQNMEGRSDATVVMPPPIPVPESRVPAGGEAAVSSRYMPGSEIGRGGLARVVEARDTELDRRVALKLLAPDAEAGLVARFREEARITGQLEHPNIVPVHGMGELSGSRECFMAMKRISGRDMKQVIRAGSWPLRQLVESFRDICRAVAYAHSQGIVHRDLKPANVMLGEFGEVLVVDWGLARRVAIPHIETGERHAGAAEPVSGTKTTRVAGRAPSSTPDDGVIGTPSYMSPEQAAGRVAEVDERSDVYSLGATLYEILARRAPFEGSSGVETIRLVLAGNVPPPSRFHEVPAEIEAICLKAMSFRREDRYGSVVELGLDVESYLKGTREHEGRARLAEEQVSLAIAETERSSLLKMKSDAERVGGNAEIKARSSREWLENARVRWRHQDEADVLRRESIEALAAADAALDMALTLDPESRRARELKAGLQWERFLEAESKGDVDAAILSRRIVERFNDGAFDSRLSGLGSIEIVTRVWTCECLTRGCEVPPADLAVLGFHPWSGRALDGRPVEVLDGMEPAAAIRLRVHSESCLRTEAPGARVWAWRYESVDRIQVPRTPGRGDPGFPVKILDSLFGDSPFRPQGNGMFLGLTPLHKRPLAMGSWLLVIIPEEGEPLRIPVSVRRQSDVRLDLMLPGEGDLPRGFLRVPAGEFTWQGDRELPGSMKAELRQMDDFLIARHPVTCAEYAVFLNDLLRSDPAEAAARAPREALGSSSLWPIVSGQGFVVPTEERQATGGARIAGSPVDWQDDWPILGISWADACAYSRWLSIREQRLFFVPHEAQREKAARGPDGRCLPWGDEFLDLISNSNQAYDSGPRPTSVGSFPHDESPYGVRGLAGNARDWCLNDPGESVQIGWRCNRGGSWLNPPPMSRAAFRAAARQNSCQSANTIRLATVLSLPAGTGHWPLLLP